MPDTKVVTVGDARQQRLADITRLMGDVNVHLVSHGYQPYRIGEFLHPNGRHIRKNYAGGEWIITVSFKHRSEYKPIETMRFDSRVDRSLPTAEDLALRLA